MTGNATTKTILTAAELHQYQQIGCFSPGQLGTLSSLMTSFNADLLMYAG